MANEAVDAGRCDLLGFGEMGIGNTTSASAITAALTGLPAVDAVIGSGAGADDACMSRKRSAIERALVLHAERLGTPFGILQCVGGFEIAAMCGFVLAVASRRVPVVTDGFIATSAAALAVRMCPAASGYLFASHRSTEPGHAHLLKLIDQEPLLDLGMRLGEGTGAALAMQVIRAAIAAFTEMATFGSAGVSKHWSGQVRSLLAAIAFLTRIPIGEAAFDANDVAHSAGWFPLIGALLGAAYCGIAWALKPHLPAVVIAVLLVTVDALATGALHFDGLADMADGFGGGKTRDDVLRIMRDHAIGSYGGLALVLVVALRIAAYTSLLAQPAERNWMVALIVTPALGRWSILLLTAMLPYARPGVSVAGYMGGNRWFGERWW